MTNKNIDTILNELRKALNAKFTYIGSSSNNSTQLEVERDDLDNLSQAVDMIYLSIQDKLEDVNYRLDECD